MPALLQFSIFAIFGAGLISAFLIVLMRPLLERYALARPNARSSHKTPTPQGGGIAIVLATVVTTFAGSLWLTRGTDIGLLVVLGAAAALSVVGAIDDIRPLRPETRLITQALAVSAVVATFPTNHQIIPFVPFILERAILVVAGVWFVNLVNFMDGIDLMTVSEIAPVAAALAVFGVLGALPVDGSIVAVALLGALLGFSPFNAPRARLFMGDVGSLPIGLLVGWLLAHLAFSGHLAAALLLPLYYLADATITLMRRMITGRDVFNAHRDHYYQQAHDSGRSTYWIVSRVVVTNGVLAVLAFWTIASGSWVVETSAGVVLVALLLGAFQRRNSEKRCR